MKKYLTLLVMLVLVCVSLAACTNKASSSEHEHSCVAVEGKAAGCTEAGVIDHFVCSDCGKLFADSSGNGEITDTSVSALGHTGGAATCVAHAVCTRCGQEYGELEEHDFGEFEQTKAPTCTEDGERTAFCSVCEEPKSEPIAALGHSGEWIVVAEPRCFDNGEEQLICTTCDALVFRSIPSFNSHDLMDSTCVGGKQCTRCNYVEGTGNGHAFDDWVITRAATCTEDGTKERECLVCDYKEYGVALRTSHTGDWSYVTAPTCTENGEQGKTCTSCGHYETKIAYKTGHSGEWSVTKEATCTTNGEKQLVCTECGETEKALIPSAHKYNDWTVYNEPTCTENGRQSRICAVCGFTQESSVPKTGHSMTWEITQEPTCTENGVKVGTCSKCGQKENAVAEKLGHDLQGGTCVDPSRCTRCNHAVMNTHIFGEPYEIIWPDCERHGTMNQTCTVCGYVYQYSKYPVGHTYSDWELRVAPTCTELGRERRICTVCGKAEDRSVALEEHTLSEWIVTADADCTTDGHKHKICTACLDVMIEEVIPALGHDFADATCTAPMICTRCSVTDGNRLSTHLLEYNADFGLTVCSCCNSVLLNDKFLQFTLSDDGNSYYISEITNSYFSISYAFNGVILPDTYNGKPVTGIYYFNSQNSYVFIPKSIEIISEQAFNYNEDVRSVFFEQGSNLKVIGNQAFAYCSNLIDIELPEGIESIGDYAFDGCYSLVSVELPEGLVEIGEQAFNGCNALTSVTFPSTLEIIGKAAFYNCHSLTSALLPANLKSIGDHAFSYCTGLVNVILPDGTPYIGSEVFVGCDNIEYGTVKDGLKYLGSASNPYFYLADAESNITSAVVAEGCVYIGERAFAGCSQLKTVVMPDGLKRIYGYAFDECPELLWLIIPSSLEYYGSHAFGDSYELIMYFIGSEEQWKSVEHSNELGNAHLFHGDIYYYSETYIDWMKYWHYDENGDPVRWEMQ